MQLYSLVNGRNSSKATDTSKILAPVKTMGILAWPAHQGFHQGF